MRGSDERTGSLFSYVGIEARLRPDHPLRAIRALADETLAAMERDLAALYSNIGRPSIAPQMLLRAMLLQAVYSVRSERQLMERMEFDLLFRWFVGLGADEPVWDPSSFSKNRDRLLAGDVAARFLAALPARPRVKRLLSSDHFSVDGTMIQAWSSMKSVKPIEGKDDLPPSSGGRDAETDFRGTTRTNATHASATDPEAKLYRKGPGMEARLAFLGHALMENRHGLAAGAGGHVTTARSAIVGRWRIVEVDLWDRDHLDLCGPASPVVGAVGDVETGLHRAEGDPAVAVGADDIHFTWCDFDEMDEAQGDGSAASATTARSVSTSPTKTATRLSPKPCETLLQQPANVSFAADVSDNEFKSHGPFKVATLATYVHHPAVPPPDTKSFF